MNDYNFFVEFTTKGLVELKDGLKDINTKFDNLGNTFAQSSTKGDSFFGKFGGWINGLVAMSGAIAVVGKAIKDTFNVGNQVIQLNQIADAAGTTAEEVEALSIALKPFSNGGDTLAMAGSYYQAMLNTKTDMWRNKYSDSVIEEMSRAGIYISRDATPEQYMKALSEAMTVYTNRGDEYSLGSRKKLADAFGLDTSMMLFLSSGWDNVQKLLNYGKEHSYLSGEENLKEAQELRKATMELKEAWGRMLTDFMPEVKSIVESMHNIFDKLAPVLEVIVEALAWIMEKYSAILDKVTGWGKKAGEWIGNKISNIRRAGALRDMEDFAKMSEEDWKKADFGKMNQAYARAKIYLDEHPEYAEDYSQVMSIAGDRLKQIGKARFNTVMGTGGNTVNNSPSVNIENQNIYTDTEKAGKDVGSATQRELGRLDFNSANLATMEL